MKEDQEIIARALEIAINLTKADYKYLQLNEINRGSLHLKEPLFTTLKNVIRVINSKNLIDNSTIVRVFPGEKVLPDKD